MSEMAETPDLLWVRVSPDQHLYIWGQASVYGMGCGFDDYWNEGDEYFGHVRGRLVRLLDTPRFASGEKVRVQHVGMIERFKRWRKGLVWH